MERTCIHDMEIGNLLFGNSRGAFQIPRTEGYETVFSAFLERSGFGSYGEILNEKLEQYRTADGCGFENDVFVLRPYYWGEDEKKMELPNFYFKPKKVEIRWYKYPFRDAYCSTDIDEMGFMYMLAECEKSLDDVYGGRARTVERMQTFAEYQEQTNMFGEMFGN